MVESKKRVLTGVKPTGVPHIANYLAAIRPAIELAETHDSFLFIADLHALTKKQDPQELIERTYAVAAAWLAFGLDPKKTTFYRQSDIPEVATLAWILSCVTPLGMLSRAHSVKEAREKGQGDEEINHGLFSYPVLMAADILLFDTDVVPVGKDQKQHLEITQEAARKLNNAYGEVLKIPAAKIDEKVMTIPGTDGQKMSKSYGNTIQLFVSDKELLKTVKQIKTDSTPYGEPLSTKNETVFELYQLVAKKEQTEQLRQKYAAARKDPTLKDEDLEDPKKNYFGWGDAKKALNELLVTEFKEARNEYQRLMSDKAYLDQLLKEGAERARETAREVLGRVLAATGVR